MQTEFSAQESLYLARIRKQESMTATTKNITFTLGQWNLLAASAHPSNANGIPLWGATTTAGKALVGAGLGSIWEGKFHINEAGVKFYQDNITKK